MNLRVILLDEVLTCAWASTSDDSKQLGRHFMYIDSGYKKYVNILEDVIKLLRLARYCLE